VPWFYGYTRMTRHFSGHLYFRHTYKRPAPGGGMSNTPGGWGGRTFDRDV